MKSVLITGANRGLGLGIVKYLTKLNRTENIFATCRNASEELVHLSKENKNVRIINFDVTDMSKYDSVASQISSVTGDRGLNLLINNAGVATKFTKINLVKAEQLMENFKVNTIAPIMLTQALLRLLIQAAETNVDKPVGIERAAVINFSSLLGSIANNDQGGFYPYRCSKAALNAATKSMSVEFKDKKILATAIHPGWVKTDMGGKNAPLDVDTSIRELFNTLANLGEGDSGKLIQYDGKELPW